MGCRSEYKAAIAEREDSGERRGEERERGGSWAISDIYLMTCLEVVIWLRREILAIESRVVGWVGNTGER